MQDNYVWVLQEPSGQVAIVDPSEAEPVAKRLRELGLTPSYILNTHHHWDHTGAILCATQVALSTVRAVMTVSLTLGHGQQRGLHPM